MIRIRRWRRALPGLLALWLVLSLSGCTTIRDTAKGTVRAASDTSRKLTGAFSPSGSDLKSKIALIGIENQPAAGPPGFSALFQKRLTEFLHNECRASLVDATAGEVLKSPPRLASGQVDGYALALMGRPRGLNFFVIGTLSDARLADEKTGFWLWKDTRYTIRAVLRVEAIDSATGAKAMDETLADEVVIDELRHEQLKTSGSLPFAEIEPILNRMLPEAAYRVCETINRLPWQGFIVAAGDGRITVSSGSAVGLSAGRMLEVYGSASVVESKDGRRFLKPGERVGEARVAGVSSDRADAILSQPSPVTPGGTVRLK
jgi:hypothetical protein